MKQPLVIFNSLTREKEVFQPMQSGKVKLYVCGITVYDYCHLGHGRMMVTFDMVTRVLRSFGYDVTYIRNITDIDDKIIKRAAETNITPEALAEKFTLHMHEDERALMVLSPDEEPRATEYIPQMLNMIKQLIDNKHAYVAGNGDICYRVNSFKGYGKLSHKDIEGLRAGARVDIVVGKEDPLDFVLWKLAKPGEPAWDSPWGKGRPGWHIECSAMSTHCLGNHFDIHGGGFDLQFPHHENEIAQAEGATGEKFVNTWMHLGFVQTNKEKMSKSLGNFFTIREVLKKYSGEVVRYFMLSSHYRSPINYSPESLALAESSLANLYQTLRGLPTVQAPDNSEHEAQFNAVMLDDFNTPQAFAVLFDLAHVINRQKAANQMELASGNAALLKKLGGILGFLTADPEQFLKSGASAEKAEEIEALIADRNRARVEKDWQTADKIRAQLTAMGIELEDQAGKTTWRKLVG